ncbi:DUF6300 family protein [Streptomyces phaeochromogenes]|uniref:DUF6300 family protein n=1 Tax=Streptomyces phaeochromogenes TaxID=1923 RepID=UPI0006E214B2|nr:DUF6300 family protein [Streptomyces phaeochromogenes]
MSFTWRYLVRPDGSFSRMGNIDGSLDNLSDEELDRLRPDDRDDDEPPARLCSRCGADLLLHWHGPLTIGVWMELCVACDAHRPAARAFIRWHRDPDRDPAALPHLFEDWETETMHAHGWARAQEPEVPFSPPAPPGLTPRGRG